MESLVATGKAPGPDYNSVAWFSMLAGAPADKVVERARRAVDLDGRRSGAAGAHLALAQALHESLDRLRARAVALYQAIPKPTDEAVAPRSSWPWRDDACRSWARARHRHR